MPHFRPGAFAGFAACLVSVDSAEVLMLPEALADLKSREASR
jgi:hypothetical protein